MNLQKKKEKRKHHLYPILTTGEKKIVYKVVLQKAGVTMWRFKYCVGLTIFFLIMSC